MDAKTLIFGIIMLALLPLWPIAMLMPDRSEIEARRHGREVRCRELIVVACEQGDYDLSVELVAYWAGINPEANGPRQIGIVFQSTLSREAKLAAVARIARGAGPSE